MNMVNNSDWFDDYAEDSDDVEIDEYEITATRMISMYLPCSVLLNLGL
jgi:hypothetical protein